MKRFSFADFFITFFVFIALLVGYLHPITAITQDLGRHILTGNIILSTHHVPKVNLFSYTFPNFPFINHHYGSEVIFALLQKWIGFQGLLFMTTFVAITAFLFVFFAAKNRSSTIAVGITALLAIGFLYERTDVRPELFSFLFAAIFTVILYRNRDASSKALFILIPLELAWTQMHIYFPVGLLLVGLFLVDAVVTHHKNLRHQSVKYLLITLIGCGLVTLINPNGLIGALYPLHVFQNYGYGIEENQNIFFLQSLFHKTSIRFYETYVVASFLSFALTAKKRRPVDWLLLGAFSILGAQAERNMPLLAYTTLIPFAESLTDVLHTVIKSATIKEIQKKVSLRNLSIIALCFLFVWQITARNTRIPMGTSVPSGANPAADFFLSNHLSGPIFNNFDIGSFIEYRVYPNTRVFIDGRPEAYPAEFIQNTYIPMQNNPTIFQKVDSRYHFNTIFFSHTDQTPWAETFLKTIMQDKNWIPIYLDDTIIILVKNKTSNEALIQKYGMPFEKLHITGHEENTKQSISQLIHLFGSINDIPQEKNYLERLLTLDPKNCQVLSILSNIYSTINPEMATIDNTKYQQYCQ